MNWKPYPKYRVSGIRWVSELPEHWRVARLKRVADVRFSSVDKHSLDGEVPVRLCNYVDVYHHDHITQDLPFMPATATRAESHRFTLRRGDVLVTKDSEEWTDIAVAAHVEQDLDGVLCGYHLAHLRPMNGVIRGDYLCRSFSARALNAQLQVEATGITRYGLGKDAIDNALFLVPPSVDQRAIAAFLDRETARIDALIEKKEQQIELLEEKRGALIHHAVTRGLDPSAPLRDSSIEWIGQIPAHGSITRLKYVTSRIEQGWSPQCESGQAGPDEWGVLKAGCANGGVFDETENKTLPADIEPLREYEIRVGDVLISRACGTRELVGSAALVHQVRPRLLLCDKLFRIVPRPSELIATFLVYFLGSRLSRYQLERDVQGASGLALNIGQETVKELVIPLPPIGQQQDVAQFLDEELRTMDRLRSAVDRSIEMLHEFRTALISAAVTGKIDVRAEATA